MLARGGDAETLDIPLGPEIGQCCGGRTLLVGRRGSTPAAGSACAPPPRPSAGRCRRCMIFGAGHVGRALAAALALLPVRPVLVDQRAEELALAPAGVETVLTPLPEEAVRRAAAGAAFVVLTHDHALDFLIAREALARGDAAYVGMIGSRTKRVSFERWLKRADDGAPLDTARARLPDRGGRPAGQAAGGDRGLRRRGDHADASPPAGGD